MKCWRTAHGFPVEGRPDSLKAFCMKPLLERDPLQKVSPRDMQAVAEEEHSSQGNPTGNEMEL